MNIIEHIDNNNNNNNIIDEIINETIENIGETIENIDETIEEINNETIGITSYINETISETISGTISDNNINTINTINKAAKKRTQNIRENNYYIPKYNEYNSFKSINYKHTHLKKICKLYNLKISGNKSQLGDRIYNYLSQSYYSIIIQKYVRRHFIQLYFKLSGPAIYNRSLCMNSTDFFSLEKINTIPFYEFYSYKDKDNIIWGFSMISIYNLFKKSGDSVLNPYNRNEIDESCYYTIKKLTRLNKIFKNPINLILNNNEDNFSSKKKIELKCLELFQYIDELGNYTDVKWFTSLNQASLIQFIRELLDIWQYRAQLSNITKKEICYPYGNPFIYLDLQNFQYYNLILLQKNVLAIIEEFIKKGITRELQNLGASYILCAFTLVNHNAAVAMPWLYQSVS
jgi:hypothetical protein